MMGGKRRMVDGEHQQQFRLPLPSLPHPLADGSPADLDLIGRWPVPRTCPPDPALACRRRGPGSAAVAKAKGLAKTPLELQPIVFLHGPLGDPGGLSPKALPEAGPALGRVGWAACRL